MKNLEIKPILSALGRHKAGTILIVLQIGLTFAIISNAFFIVAQRIDRASRPTGVTESDLIAIHYHRTDTNASEIPSRTAADLNTLRRLPGVQDATQSNAFPLSGHSSTEGIRLDPAVKARIALAAEYFTDEHALGVLGAHLIAGRNFRSDEVRIIAAEDSMSPAAVIITKALADKVFRNTSALGKQLFIGNNSPSPSTVIGIVDRLQAPTPTPSFAEDVVMIPALLSGADGNYLIRSEPGKLPMVTRDSVNALVELDATRVFPTEDGVRTFETVRGQAYEADRGMVSLMLAISSVLLVTTAAGIVGLSTFWVSQRTRQIGMRRALGATQRDILRYFLTENFLLASGGVILGTVLALALNIWMASYFETKLISVQYLFAGVVLLVVLGQAAVFAPAWRASRTEPIVAIRNTTT